MEAGYEEIEHTADWAIRVWAPDLRALFETAARGMVSLLRAEGGNAPFQQEIAISRALDDETLLVDWLTELVYLIEDDNVHFTNIKVQSVTKDGLRATITGSMAARYDKHIKAVTYYDLAIRERKDGYETTITFDV